jgi:tetratricopeptide (TPR) repeat protein
MKNYLLLVIGICCGIAGTIAYVNRAKPSQTPAPAADVVSAPSQPVTPAPTPMAHASLPQAESQAAMAAQPSVLAAQTAVASTTASITNQSPVEKMVDGLLSAKNGLEKHELFQKIVKAGQIDDVIAALKQRAADNPNDASSPTTLGEAQLNKLKALKDAGADNNELGILAMQADQSFNAALKIDPQNWEAQFVKASSMYYWPADPARDNDVVQRLSGLVDQQETLPSQPEFAQTYMVLGNEYQKIGQPDKAMATWQLGLQKFPGDSSLQKKVSGQ